MERVTNKEPGKMLKRDMSSTELVWRLKHLEDLVEQLKKEQCRLALDKLEQLEDILIKMHGDGETYENISKVVGNALTSILTELRGG